MATETKDNRAAHLRGIKVTAVASLGGIVAGLATPFVDPTGMGIIGLATVFVAVVVEFGIMHVLGVDLSEFGKKDQLYVAFMTLALWFITMTVLLTTNSLSVYG